MANVVVYSTSYCPYCVRAKELLKRKGQDFHEMNAEDDAVREEMIKKANGRRTVPQIFINDLHIGGFDDLYALDRDGKLDPLLAA